LKYSGKTNWTSRKPRSSFSLKKEAVLKILIILKEEKNFKENFTTTHPI